MMRPNLGTWFLKARVVVGRPAGRPNASPFDPRTIARAVGAAYQALEAAMAAHDVNSAHLAACSLEDASARFAFDDMRRASTCLREALDEGDMAAALVFIPPLREAITSLAATLLRLEREGQKERA